MVNNEGNRFEYSWKAEQVHDYQILEYQSLSVKGFKGEIRENIGIYYFFSKMKK